MDMMSLDYLNHLLGCMDDIEEETRPSQQHTQPESQIALARGEAETETVVDFTCISMFVMRY